MACWVSAILLKHDGILNQLILYMKPQMSVLCCHFSQKPHHQFWWNLVYLPNIVWRWFWSNMGSYYPETKKLEFSRRRRLKLRVYVSEHWVEFRFHKLYFFRHMKAHNQEKYVNVDELSQPQLIMQHFRGFDLDKNGYIDGLEILKSAIRMNGT